jgi:hypothetical protein
MMRGFGVSTVVKELAERFLRVRFQTVGTFPVDNYIILHVHATERVATTGNYFVIVELATAKVYPALPGANL